MKVDDHFFDRIDRAMVLWRRIDIAAIEINAVRINPVMPTIYPIWVQYGEQVKHKLVS